MSGTRGSELELGAEWRILELLCLGPEAPDRRRELDDLLSSTELHWGELLEQALRNRMLPLLAHHVVDTASELAVPLRIEEHLRTSLEANRHRRRIWYREAGRVAERLDAEGIAVAGRKAVAYEATLYEGLGSRWLGDIDLLVHPRHARDVETIMHELGYEIGLYDPGSRSVVSFDREELAKYRLNPDHLPTFSLVVDDPVVDVLEVDVALGLTWARSGYEIPVDEAFSNVRKIDVGVEAIEVPCLSPSFQFLDTVLHLFREAWFEKWLDLEQDVDLMKFGDVIRLARRYRDDLEREGFADLVQSFGVPEPVSWVLEHLDRTFGTDVLSGVGLRDTADESWLASARSATGEVRRWRGTMRERLHAKDRRAVFAATSVREASVVEENVSEASRA